MTDLSDTLADVIGLGVDVERTDEDGDLDGYTRYAVTGRDIGRQHLGQRLRELETAGVEIGGEHRDVVIDRHRSDGRATKGLGDNFYIHVERAESKLSRVYGASPE